MSYDVISSATLLNPSSANRPIRKATSSYNSYLDLVNSDRGNLSSKASFEPQTGQTTTASSNPMKDPGFFSGAFGEGTQIGDFFSGANVDTKGMNESAASAHKTQTGKNRQAAALMSVDSLIGEGLAIASNQQAIKNQERMAMDEIDRTSGISERAFARNIKRTDAHWRLAKQNQEIKNIDVMLKNLESFESLDSDVASGSQKQLIL